MDRPPRRALTFVLLLPLLLLHLACSAGKPISLRIDPTTGELTVTDHRTHQDWRQTRLRIGPTPRQTLVSSNAGEMTFDCLLPAADRHWQPTLAHFELTARVAGDDLHLTFRHLDPARELYAVDYPYVFLPPFRDARTLYPHGEGMLVPAAMNDPDYLPLPDSDDPGLYSGLGAYMACLGLVSPSTGQGMLTIFDSPELSGYRFQPAPGGLSLPVIHLSADKYHLARRQHFVLHFSDRGGYVALAGRYRRYVADAGRHVTLADKRSRVPGASIFWIHDTPANVAAVAREMSAAGVQRAVVNIQEPGIVKGEPPPGLADAIREIVNRGYLASRYDQYRDCFRPDPAASGYEQINRDAWPDAVVRKEDGSMLVRWSGLPVGDGPKTPGRDYAVSISPKYRIPFYSLVHHDEVVITWRWEDGLGAVPAFDRDKELWCVLYGNPPLYFMDRTTWAAHRAEIQRREHDLGPWLRHVAGRRMRSHRFLTADHFVQETTFDDVSRPHSCPNSDV